MASCETEELAGDHKKNSSRREWGSGGVGGRWGNRRVRGGWEVGEDEGSGGVGGRENRRIRGGWEDGEDGDIAECVRAESADTDSSTCTGKVRERGVIRSARTLLKTPYNPLHPSHCSLDHPICMRAIPRGEFQVTARSMGTAV
jgi:hypothetical protein